MNEPQYKPEWLTGHNLQELMKYYFSECSPSAPEDFKEVSRKLQDHIEEWKLSCSIEYIDNYCSKAKLHMKEAAAARTYSKNDSYKNLPQKYILAIILAACITGYPGLTGNTDFPFMARKLKSLMNRDFPQEV